MEIDVVNRQRGRRVAPAPLARFVRRLSRAVGPSGPCRLEVVLVGDVAMRRLQRVWRGRRGTTDVLSFAGDERPDPTGVRHLGDVVVSVPQAARQARAAGHPVAREIRILVLHGYLHLLGYDHETDDGSMMRLQRRLERRLLPGRKGDA